MKNRTKHSVVSWSRFFWCTVFVAFPFVCFTAFQILDGGRYQPILPPTYRTPVINAVSGHFSPVINAVSGDFSPAISIRETVRLPDQTLLFLRYPPSSPLLAKEDMECIYSSEDSSQLQLKKQPILIDTLDRHNQIVRCPPSSRGYTVSLALKSAIHVSSGTPYSWDSLVYEALIDRDNTTLVFVKGFNLRAERLSDATRFECVYGWNFTGGNFMLRGEVIYIAQEIVRCKTPSRILDTANSSFKVSVRVKGTKTLQPSIAQVGLTEYDTPTRKQFHLCMCTMVRNGANSLLEWVMYHGRIGVERWFLYDNNSDDNINEVIETLLEQDYNVSRHPWPWIKTQEAGFAHCALRARDTCEWVGFIDVDEFLHLPPSLTLDVVTRNYSLSSNNVGELRTSCYSFGPSGLKDIPRQGKMVGYTCRMLAPERHKSIVKPEALNATLINVVHHFHLRQGYESVNLDKSVMVINHYKYQVWEVFKEKFYRRVATYVADWQEEQNIGAKDRAPGLGTRAVEPPDWSSRFCEVWDTGLRDRVLEMFHYRLPWQERDASTLEDD